MNQQVFNGNNIELLKKYPDNYFDAVVTDPPYGLGKEPNAVELMKDWIEYGYHEISGKGFMGKEWDAFVPQPIFWNEVFRVLKHGGHVLSFFGTRTYDWGVMSMRFAGFEVRDCIQWLYGSGFPKSHNISKALDKIGNNNQNWDGWGTALKPANEPIVLARKPLEKGLSIAENILKWGVGGINIDASRIGTRTENESGWSKTASKASEDRSMSGANYDRIAKDEIGIGRFPANIILTHHEDCVCKGTKKVKPSNGSGKASEKGGGFSKGMFGDGTSDNIGGGFTDADGNETIEDWNCHEDCPIRILDEQSGISKSSGGNSVVLSNSVYGKYSTQKNNDGTGFGDKGGASRFFYVAKASKSERNKGLDDFDTKQTQGIVGGIGDYEDDVNSASGKYGSEKAPNKNFHTTVKPIKLMQYLVKMITPPNGIVLDPFCGSGTTGVACKIDGFNFVGLEQDAEYTKIAEARINNYIIEPKQIEMF